MENLLILIAFLGASVSLGSLLIAMLRERSEKNKIEVRFSDSKNITISDLNDKQLRELKEKIVKNISDLKRNA